MHTFIKYYISGGTTGYKGIPVYPHIVMCVRDATTMVKVRVLLNLPQIAHRYRASVTPQLFLYLWIAASTMKQVVMQLRPSLPSFPSSVSASRRRQHCQVPKDIQNPQVRIIDFGMESIISMVDLDLCSFVDIYFLTLYL